MTRRNGLPVRVYPRHGRYYYVQLDGKWEPLTRIKEGMPAMYRALAALTDTANHGDGMPAVTMRWHASKVDAGDWSAGMQENMAPVVKEIAERLAAFTPRQITTPAAFQFLKKHTTRWRAYNLRRSVLRQVLSFAALEGLRDGYNPIDDIPQRKAPKRIRIVKPEELAAMAQALMTAARGGPAHCRMLALCLKTGQRVGDVIQFRAEQCVEEGIEVDQDKTGAPLTIEWDDELREIVDQCFEGREREGYLLVQSTGAPYRYGGVRSAWVRAMAKAGISNLHIHDLRGEAGARLADLLGSYAAQLLLGHESLRMTEHYIAGKTRRRATPAPLKKALKSVQPTAGKPHESSPEAPA